MKRTSKIGIVILILFLVIGFALVTTNLIINGGVKIGTADFDVYFSYVNTNTGNTATISNDKKTITFNTKELNTVGEQAVLVFRVMNSSRDYDASVSINANITDIVNGKDYSEYFEIIEDGFEAGSTGIISANTEETGKRKITLKKAPTEDVQIEFSITITVNAVERTLRASASDGVTLSNYITNLSQNNSEGFFTDDPDLNIRYVGSNPNNYIKFNGELWRIIGVFDGKTKIMREEPLGEYSYDGNDSDRIYNAWDYSALKDELNGDYLDTTLTEDTYWYTGKAGNTYRTARFFHEYVIKSSAQSFIDDATWYLGAPNNENNALSYSESTNDFVYNQERSNNLGGYLNDNDEYVDGIERFPTWVGKIGLPYLSDYLYSKEGMTFDYSTCEQQYISSIMCEGKSWMGLQTAYTFMDPRLPDSQSMTNEEIYQYWGTINGGYVNTIGTYSPSFIRPTLYLKSDTIISNNLSEDGSKDHPYTLRDEEAYTNQACDILTDTCDLDTIGSHVRIGDEEFYVIGQEDSTHVKLFSKYNLRTKGLYFYENNELKQSSIDKGLDVTMDYYAAYTSYLGGVTIASTNYWSSETNYPVDIYNENTALKQYVDDYVDILNSKGVNTTGRIIRLDELNDLINDGNPLTSCSLPANASYISGKEWVYNSGYWTSTAAAATLLYGVYGNGDLSSISYTYGNKLGVRPVIILER